MFKDTSFLKAFSPKPAPRELVYFVSTKQRSFPVKIGRTTDFFAARRLTQIQLGSPYQLEFFAVVEAPPEYERELHDRYARAALRGEWFERTPDLIRLMDTIRRDNPQWRLLVRAPRPGLAVIEEMGAVDE